MPKISVDEYCQPAMKKYEVWLPMQVVFAPPFTNFIFAHQAKEAQLGSAITVAPNPSHDSRAFVWFETVRHATRYGFVGPSAEPEMIVVCAAGNNSSVY